jgi:hypothetical protein
MSFRPAMSPALRPVRWPIDAPLLATIVGWLLMLKAVGG